MRLDDYKWFVVQTAPRMEAAAALDLRRRGYATLYLHTAEWKAKSKTKSKLVKKAWLTNYIFVGLREDQFVDGVPLLADAATAIGVVSIVRCGNYPLPMSLKAMFLITHNVELVSGLVHAPDLPKPQFAGKPGWEVKLGDTTAFHGFRAAIDRIDPNGQITVLIESFGRQTPAIVRQDQIDELYTPEGEAVDMCEPTRTETSAQ